MKTTCPLLLLLLFIASCKPFSVIPPGGLETDSQKFYVKGSDVSIIGHELSLGPVKGRMYSGFSYSDGKEKRLFPIYFDLNKRMNYISNHFAKHIDRSKTKFHFDLTDGTIHANSYCLERTTETSLVAKNVGGVNLSEQYEFEALIFTNKNDDPWRLNFFGRRDIQKGGNYFSNPQNGDGELTNNRETIAVTVVKADSMRQGNSIKKTAFSLPVGYQFVSNGRSLGFINAFERSVTIANETDPQTKMILLAAATCIIAKK
jgi:hypothetical protein